MVSVRCMKGWRLFSPNVDAFSFPIALNTSRACSALMLRMASVSGAISEMRNTVPPGSGWICFRPSVGSVSARFTMTGVDVVFHRSVEMWPGRSGFVLTAGASRSSRTMALPLASWPVMTLRIFPFMCSPVVGGLRVASPTLLLLVGYAPLHPPYTSSRRVGVSPPLLRLYAGELHHLGEALDLIVEKRAEIRRAVADRLEPQRREPLRHGRRLERGCDFRKIGRASCRGGVWMCEGR